jgi:hypothetical protein
MTYTFNAAIPQSSDFIDDSQGDLLNNNIAINGIFARNHVPMVDVTNGQGRHTFVEMTNSAGIPAPAGSLQDKSGTLYTKRGSSVSDLFYSNDNSGNQYQISNVVKTSDNNRFPAFGKNIPLGVAPYNGFGSGGWTFLPGGLLMQYGNAPADNVFGTTIVFPVPFSATPYSIQLIPVVDDTSTIRLSVLEGSQTALQFLTNSTKSSHLISFYWVAIGAY